MAIEDKSTPADALLDQERVLAEFGEFALRAEDLDGILNEACRLVGDALRTDLAKVADPLPDAKACSFVQASAGSREWSNTSLCPRRKTHRRGLPSKTVRSSHPTSGASNA